MNRGKMNLTGIVLAGGLSSRMGRDKALLPWGDSDLLHTVLDRLEPVCSELIVISNITRTISYPKVRQTADFYPQCGPLAGIQAGLLAAKNEYSFFVACDMPFLNTNAVAFMADSVEGYDAVVPFVGGYFHPLHAIYHRICLRWIEPMLTAGDYRVLNFYPKIRLRRVTAAELRPFDPELKTLDNINTPAEFSASRME